MSQEFINHIKNIDNLQGLIYQTLMETFNELNETSSDFDDMGNISNVKQLKHMILSKLKATTVFINSTKFKNACITCKAVRILALLKHQIATQYLNEADQSSTLGEILTDYKLDKKYTETFNETVQVLKGNITKFISSKSLRKQFQLNTFCIQLLGKEKKLIEETFPENKEINPPEWIRSLSKEELSELIIKSIEYLQNKDYEAFNKLTAEK
ncbi:MAG: hypothetical protein AB1782_00515 [Cyanobacteriota bacterium]